MREVTVGTVLPKPELKSMATDRLTALRARRSSALCKEPQATKVLLRTGEMVFLREEDTNWLANAKWSALETCIQSNIIQTEQVVFTYLEICMAMQIHMYM